MTRRSQWPIAFLGAGRLASALGPALAKSGYPVVAIAARSQASARRLARRIPGSRATVHPQRAIERARIVLLAVHDDAIEDLAGDLASAANADWSRYVVLHHAGSLGPESLRPLKRLGAEVGVLHPLQTLAGAAAGLIIPEGTRARIEGTPTARRIARALARAVGLVPLGPDRSWSDRQRARYHASASLASNDLLALLSHAVELMRAAGVAQREVLPALLPLIQGTLRQVEKHGISRSLTGPAVRGDTGTLRRHLRELRSLSPDGAEVHRLLSLRLVELAENAGADIDDELRSALAGGSDSRPRRNRRDPGRASKSKV